ncbi:mitochondrial cardiolipin hydrolase-like [Copidosoma floridanum]|uniref:mitochondrial cardiolipin hydrolase-like n=1 Tax=Copidosoma floridanum TaxID=29053 RepID=UPI0006C9748F|nr:mitochondrial cardiolipin hydrolase-like [Copidosoma floridanum]
MSLRINIEKLDYIGNQKLTSTLKAYLKSATKSLDVCVYYFTHDDLASLLIESHKKNIQVRVITDAQFATIGVIPRLKEEGIEVRSVYAVSGKMNNKFAIVDKTLLITGSGSWTYQALMNNEENIVVTNNPGFFKDYGYDKYFEQLWAKPVWK